MKNTLVLLFILSVNQIKASNYYFSTVGGDDFRTPLQAQNPATPWRSLGKLSSFSGNLRPGDSLLLKRGQIFYGSIAINKSGTRASPIVISAYGAGAKPVVTGFLSLEWQPLKNSIFESQELPATYINLLTINGVLTGMGRYPDDGYLTFESHNGTSSITDEQLTATPGWTGAEMVLRTRRWILDRDVITAHSGNTLSYTPSSKYEPRDKYGYFIQNSPLTLNRQGEWYYDPSTKKVSLYSTSAPTNVKVAIIDKLIKFSNSSYIVVDNLKIEGAATNAVAVSQGSRISLTNCDIAFSGETGIKVANHAYFTMERCTLSNSLNNGIDLGTGSHYAVIRNSLIQNTAVLPGSGGSGDHKGIAIFTKSSNTTIENNKITNSGYSAIYFGSDSVAVKNNLIDTFCTVKDDGAGIYSYIGASPPRKGSSVTGNIVMNGIGAPDGTDYAKKEATGIYMDNNSSDVRIEDNTITACNNYGIYIHNARGLIIKNNTVFDNTIQLAMIQNPGNNLVRDNTITDNILFSKVPGQLAAYFKSGANDIDLFAAFDNNYYAKPLEGKLMTFNKRLNDAASAGAESEPERWKAVYGRDETVKSAAAAGARPFKPDYLIRFEYNPTTSGKTVSLGGTYADIRKNKYAGSIVLKPYTSLILIREK